MIPADDTSATHWKTVAPVKNPSHTGCKFRGGLVLFLSKRPLPTYPPPHEKTLWAVAQPLFCRPDSSLWESEIRVSNSRSSSVRRPVFFFASVNSEIKTLLLLCLIPNPNFWWFWWSYFQLIWGARRMKSYGDMLYRLHAIWRYEHPDPWLNQAGCDGGSAICRDMYRGISPPSTTDSHSSVTWAAVHRVHSAHCIGLKNTGRWWCALHCMYMAIWKMCKCVC